MRSPSPCETIASKCASRRPARLSALRYASSITSLEQRQRTCALHPACAPAPPVPNPQGGGTGPQTGRCRRSPPAPHTPHSPAWWRAERWTLSAPQRGRRQGWGCEPCESRSSPAGERAPAAGREVRLLAPQIVRADHRRIGAPNALYERGVHPLAVVTDVRRQSLRAAPRLRHHELDARSAGFTGGWSATRAGTSSMAGLISTATGLRLFACDLNPGRCASSSSARRRQRSRKRRASGRGHSVLHHAQLLRRQHGAVRRTAGIASGAPRRQRSCATARLGKDGGALACSYGDNRSMFRKSRWRSRCWSATVRNRSGHADESSANCAKRTARSAAR